MLGSQWWKSNARLPENVGALRESLKVMVCSIDMEFGSAIVPYGTQEKPYFKKCLFL